MTLFPNIENYSTNIVVVTDRGETLTYSKLFETVSLVGNYINKRSLSFCLCKNVLGSFIGYVSLFENGVVPVMLDGTKDSSIIDNLLDIYKPNYIWVSKDDYQKQYGPVLLEIYDYYLTHYNKDIIRIYDELALLLTTSGSTGSPKLVRLSYENVLTNAESIAEYLRITKDERPVTSLPMYYSYGLSVINSHLINGATILLTDKTVIQKEFWTFIMEQKATSIAGVPYTYEMLHRLHVLKMDLPYLRTLTQAGGKLNSKLVKEYVEQAKEANKEFIVMYGQTEATARMSYLPFRYALDKYSSIGIAIPGGEFSLIDAGGNTVNEINIDGELVYMGKNVSLGYSEFIDDLARGDENCGILHTGDVARKDEDGFYYITGRLKRFVKIYGNRVNLDAVEQLVKEVTSSCACIGVDDKITIFITTVDIEDKIKNFLSMKTGLNSRVFAVRVIDLIPKSSAGKIQYVELQKLLE